MPELNVCPDDQGVTVLVEPGSLGGPDRAYCATDGADTPVDELFAEAGWDLTPVASAPGAICRVDDLPKNVGCAQMPPADAYWSLWWTDQEGEWVYSSIYAGGLTVPDGSAVAFSWVDGSDDGKPSTSLDGVADSGDSTVSETSAPEEGPTSVPVWVAPLVLAVLAVALVVVIRRRRTDGG